MTAPPAGTIRATPPTTTHVPDVAREVPPAWLLRRGIRELARCDGAEVVLGLVDFMYAQHGVLRALSAIVEGTRRTVLPSLITVLGAIKAMLLVRPPARDDGVLWVARLANERRVLQALPPRTPGLAWSETRLGWRPQLRELPALARTIASTVPRLVRLGRRLHRRQPSFQVLRAMELAGYYVRYLQLFRRGRYALAVMSSHSNPHGIAFALAARRAGVPVVLVTHGMPVRPVARLSFALAVVHCEDARRTYEAEGCRMQRVLVHGRRQHLAPMPVGPLGDALTVGVFLCKDVRPERLRALVESLLASGRVARVRLRPHPYNMWKGFAAWIAERDDARVQVSAGGSVFGDIDRCDVVLAGNTSVHIEALLAGRPSAFVPGLDHGGGDLHRLVERGLVYALDDGLRLDPEAVSDFYGRPEWPAVLRLFANVDEDDATVAARAAAIMRELARHA